MRRRSFCLRYLCEWAIDVFSRKLINANPEAKYPDLDGYEAFYAVLKNLLGLNYEIRAETKRNKHYCAPFERRTMCVVGRKRVT